MTGIEIAVEGPAGAPSAVVYRCIADYRRHHGRFLPPAFSDLAVEEGGIGAGTVITFRLRAGGQTRDYRGRVDEPEPGRRLTETYDGPGGVTTFVVTPDGEGSRVRIETTSPGRGGLAGALERFLAPRLLGPLYADELARLDRYARSVAADEKAGRTEE